MNNHFYDSSYISPSMFYKLGWVWLNKDTSHGFWTNNQYTEKTCLQKRIERKEPLRLMLSNVHKQCSADVSEGIKCRRCCQRLMKKNVLSLTWSKRKKARLKKNHIAWGDNPTEHVVKYVIWLKERQKCRVSIFCDVPTEDTFPLKVLVNVGFTHESLHFKC